MTLVRSLGVSSKSKSSGAMDVAILRSGKHQNILDVFVEGDEARE